MIMLHTATSSSLTDTQLTIMQMVTIAFMALVLVTTIALAGKYAQQFKKNKTNCSALSKTFVWIGLTFVAIMAALTGINGPLLGRLLTKITVSDIDPYVVAFQVFLVGVGFFLSALLVLFVGYERKSKRKSSDQERQQATNLVGDNGTDLR